MIFEYTLHTAPTTIDMSSTVLFILALTIGTVIAIFIARLGYYHGRYEELRRCHEDYIFTNESAKELLESECLYWRHLNNSKSFNAVFKEKPNRDLPDPQFP
jgi:hypothetical protein